MSVYAEPQLLNVARALYAFPELPLAARLPADVSRLRATGTADASAALLGTRPVWFSAEGATPTECYDRAGLRPGHRFEGPAIVHQYDTTTVVAPGWAARVDELGNLWLERP